MTPSDGYADDEGLESPLENDIIRKATKATAIDDDVFGTVMPRVNRRTIDAARRAIAGGVEDPKISRPDPPVADADVMAEMQAFSPSRGFSGRAKVAFDSEPNGAQQDGTELEQAIPFLAPADGTIGESPQRPSYRGDLPDEHAGASPAKSENGTVIVPRRLSSRPDRSSRSTTPRPAMEPDHINPRRPRPEEIEAAKRILAVAEEDEGLYCIRTTRSATPPPIPRSTRRLIYDAIAGEEEDERHCEGNGPTSPVIEDEGQPRHSPAQHNYKTKRPGSAASRQSSLPRVASRTTLSGHRGDMRTPVLNHIRLYDDADQPPTSRHGRGDSLPLRPSRRADHNDYALLEQDAGQDCGRRNGGSGAGGADRRPGVFARRTVSDDALSVARQSIARQSTTSAASGRMPDFFGPSTFQVVLHNPTVSHQLLKFSEVQFCSENVEFLAKVEQYRILLNELATVMTGIHKTFVANEAPKEINVPGALKKTVHAEMKSLMMRSVPSMESLFTDMQDKIEQLVFSEIYPRFVRHQITLDAARALASDRHRYQGLGDCFCLTNPNKADNPIVAASDGFVKVTGYSRPEIIPRNCRFLQGSQTDRTPVHRLKGAINERKESVELLLNYKKNGDPFWNLLYVAPLFNESGKVAFFIGGQVNCSTTVHSNADVMRVLSTSSTTDLAEEAKARMPPQRSKPMPAARKAILKAFGLRHDDGPDPNGVQCNAGMERKVLERMEGQDLQTQMKEFYTAYSKYLVLRSDNFVINFYSEGAIDMLHPANNTTGLVTGQDVFAFFKQNMTASQNEYKSRVRSAIRAGFPASVEIRLQTRRSALFRGDERFVTHWTPLKDENAAVHWVVVTLAPTII